MMSQEVGGIPRSSNRPAAAEMYETRHEYEATSGQELSFNKSEHLEVTEKRSDGWCYARRQLTGDGGYVPFTYLRKLPTTVANSSSENQISNSPRVGNLKAPIPQQRGSVNPRTEGKMGQEFIAQYDYNSNGQGYLTIRKKQVLKLKHPTSNEWWLMVDEKTGLEGHVPANFLTEHKKQQIAKTADSDKQISNSPRVGILNVPIPQQRSSVNPGTVGKIGQQFIAQYDYNSDGQAYLTIRKDQVLKLKRPTSNEWWLMVDEKTGLEGYVPANFLTEYKKQDTSGTAEWFVGKIRRVETEQRLMAEGNGQGSFLVRQSESRGNEYSLSVRDGNGVRHYRIQYTTEGQYCVTGIRFFDSLKELVKFYTTNSEGLSCQLVKPCIKIQRN